jgi:LysM repeat protein
MNKARANLQVGIIFLLAWLIPSIACNFPTRSRQIREISEASLRQTLTAMAGATQLEATPVPGTPETPISPAASESPAGTPVSPGPGVQPTSKPGSSTLFFNYPAQAGDTLTAVASRFGVAPEQILSSEALPGAGFLPPGQILTIPNVIGETLYPARLLPDSEIIYSPSTTDFQTHDYINGAGGFLSSFGELVDGEWTSGADILQRVAVETSINPRLLLALLEYRSRWVLGQPADPTSVSYPLGFNVPGERGLYKEMYIAAKLITMGYYGWRSGEMTDLTFPDGIKIRLSPELNAGSAALQFLFSRLNRQPGWYEALYGSDNFLVLHQQMFGDPWARAAAVEPLFPVGLTQPEIELPLPPGESWSYSGGPHLSWTTGSPRGAIDFSPASGSADCSVSQAWATASAPGLIARSSHNVVVIDLDGDGFEQTGWTLVFLHVADYERIPAGAWVNTDDPIGHPSCERGNSTGTHVHLARKYNGEWLEADGPLPFILSGWQVQKGTRSYEGYLVKGNERVTANPGGSGISIISR